MWFGFTSAYIIPPALRYFNRFLQRLSKPNNLFPLKCNFPGKSQSKIFRRNLSEKTMAVNRPRTCNLSFAYCSTIIVTALIVYQFFANTYLLAPFIFSYLHDDAEVSSSVLHFEEAFSLEYEKMEKEFKIFVYPDGDPDIYYHTSRKLTGKYASEGYFFKNINESRFLTHDPNEAHLFFIPISCHKMRGQGLSYKRMISAVENYVQSLSFKYPYWNRTLGADHFFVTCHDIGVKATEGIPYLVKNSIRVTCSSSYDNGYIPHKDVALPRVQLPFVCSARGDDTRNRHTLGFWAGLTDSEVKKKLTALWDEDTELDIQNNRIGRHVTGHIVYAEKLYKTKYCLCPRGSDISIRIADSIHCGCVPVIMSDYHDLPFNDILDWKKFSVILKETDVPELKKILKGISDRHFKKLHQNLVKVQKHFMWNSPPVRLDAFHMVMYELWLRRHVIRN